MFDVGWSEFLLIGIVALIVIGPKELPGALRTLGQWMGKLRRMASEFQGQFQEAMREAELADLKKQVDDMTSQAQSYANFDPVSEVRRELESTQQEIERGIVGEPSPAATAEAASAGTSPASLALPSAETPSPAPSTPTSEPAMVDIGTDKPAPGDKPA